MSSAHGHHKPTPMRSMEPRDYTHCTVFDLPQELLATLQLKQASPSSLPTNEPSARHPAEQQRAAAESAPPSSSPTAATSGSKAASISCGLCSTSFATVADQRRHVRTDWHRYNLKQRQRGLAPVAGELEFELLVGELDESISGSDDTSSAENTAGEDDENDGRAEDSLLSALLRRQAKLHGGNQECGDGEEEPGLGVAKAGKGGGPGNLPMVWFSSPLLPKNTSLGVFKALFTKAQLENSGPLDAIKEMQLKPLTAQDSSNTAAAVTAVTTGPKVFLCMIGGGHFAAAVVALVPRIVKKANGLEERQPVLIAHKTFHKYTTRRKQGGSQSANDSAKGNAHSAGAGMRRENERMLETEIRGLLAEWRKMIDSCELVFVRATGNTNRRVLFGPYDDQVLQRNDPRNRTFPFTTRRATRTQLVEAFAKLTRLQVSHVDEEALAAAAAAEEVKRQELISKSTAQPAKAAPAKSSKEEEAALLHTSQLQALIRRSKAPGLLSYLSTNSISPDFVFQPPDTQANHHSSTPLHLAASTNNSIIVHALLIKGGADPTVLNGEGKPAFDIVGDRATRDAFRVARSELGEGKWNWDAAHITTALSKAEAAQRDADERKESEKAEIARRAADLERLKREDAAKGNTRQNSTSASRTLLGNAEVTAQERREQTARGLTDEARRKLERTQRARAAEERIRRMQQGSGS